MRRFELVEGSSSKFWEIELRGSEIDVRWGRIGTSGQSQTKSLVTADKAQAQVDKLIKEKTGKGYAEVGVVAGASIAVSPPKAAAPAPPPTPAAARRVERAQQRACEESGAEGDADALAFARAHRSQHLAAASARAAASAAGVDHGSACAR